jgi:uncharacterized protein YndB with AHSA1/START domain
MRPIVRLAAALFLFAVGTIAHAAPSWRDFDGVSNTSFVEANGDRAIQLAIDVPAPPKQVFAAFATSEGFSSWAVPFARVDLRVGGMMETSYDFNAKPGDRDNIRNEIVAYVPDRLVVIRNVQAPRNFPDPELFARTATVIAFDPIASGTRVTVTHAGYGRGDGFDKLYAMFEWGNAYTLAGLRKRFVDGPVDWNARRAAAAAAKKTEKSD